MHSDDLVSEPYGHLRHAFSLELQALERDVLEMASMAESMVEEAVESLADLDAERALRTLPKDDEIDERDIRIEDKCLRLIALQHPTATDLRIIGTVMKMITDIERIGDLAVDIAKCGMKIEQLFGNVSYVDVHRIANLAREMLRDALQAFVRRDLDLVVKVCETDDEVDALYRELREQIHSRMTEKPEEVVSASWLLLAIHHVERIADHAVNIAERVHFMVKGQLIQIAKSHKT